MSIQTKRIKGHLWKRWASSGTIYLKCCADYQISNIQAHEIGGVSPVSPMVWCVFPFVGNRKCVQHWIQHLESGPLDIEFRTPWRDESSPAVKTCWLAVTTSTWQKNSGLPSKSRSPKQPPTFFDTPPPKKDILCLPPKKKVSWNQITSWRPALVAPWTCCWNLSFHHLHPSFPPAKHSPIFQIIEALRLAHRFCLITTCTTSLHDTSHVEAMYYSLPFLNLLHGAQMENCLGMFPFNLLWNPKRNVHFKYSSLRTFSVFTFRQVDPRHLLTARKKRCFVEQFFRMVVRLVVSLLSIYFGYLSPWGMVSGPYSVSHPIIVLVR